VLVHSNNTNNLQLNKKIIKQHQKLKDLEKLNKLSQQKQHISLYDQNIYQILVNTKDVWFNLLDELLERQYHPSTFYNRLFYICILL
jgi:Tfp pilus assembly protein PilN